jgi:hypothetical protein
MRIFQVSPLISSALTFFFLLSTILTHAYRYYITLHTPGFLVPILQLDSSIPLIYTFRRYLAPFTFIFLLYLGAFNVPVLLCVILDSTVGAEFAHLFMLLDTLNVNTVDPG